MTASLQNEASCPLVTMAAVGPRYTIAQIEAALPRKDRTPKAKVALTPVVVTLPDDRATTALIKDAVSKMMGDHPMLMLGRWPEVLTFGKRPVYPSQSEADLALASYIALDLLHRGADPSQLGALVEEVFSNSKLGSRLKWRDRRDYRRRTVGKACASALAAFSGTAGSPAVDWSQHGDVRNSNVFVAQWNERLIWLPQQKRWMRWQSSRWTLSVAGEEFECAKASCKAMYDAAGNELATNPERGQKLVREAVQAHQLPRMKAMLDLAKSDPKIAAQSALLDADPYLLGVGNGVINLRNGFHEANAPKLYITRYCNADFVPLADCPRWKQFLDEIFPNDPATIAAVQRLLGYTLTGLSTEEIIIFCVGFGANGKSIFDAVISKIMSDYAVKAPSSLLAARRLDDHGARGDIAMLAGARMVSINELPAGMQLDEGVVKQLAGREAISARHLYGDFFTFQPSFTPWVRTNHKPIIRGDDDGIWRRIVILPFRRTFTEKQRDPHLEAALLAERDGILLWMIEGAKQYIAHGLKLSPAMKAEQVRYRQESDLVGEFLAEHTTSVTGGRVAQISLYGLWDLWCRQNGVQPGAKKTFTQRLAERGFGTSKSNGKRFYEGLTTQCASQTNTGRGGHDLGPFP